MPPRIQYALLNKNVSVGLMLLIGISSRACATLDNLKFCADSAVHPRIETCSMLKCLKSPSMFKDDACNVIFKKFWDMIKTGADEMTSKVDYCIMFINVMINNKIKKKIDDKNTCRID